MKTTALVDVSEKSDIDLIHEIGSRIAAADPLQRRARPRRRSGLDSSSTAIPASSTCSRKTRWCFGLENAAPGRSSIG
jgi:hypothetical protein